jgi:hypothetical protein
MIFVAGLDDTIGNFGSLVGLILALVTLFTGTRDTSVRTLEEGTLTGKKRDHLRAESRLCWALFGATALLLLAGGPLWIRTLTHWSWSTDHSIRWGFFIVWLLLVPLALWQINIARRARTTANKP